MTRYVVVGTGVAGISAIAALRSSEPAAEITLVGEDPHGFYSRPGLAYYLTGEVPEKQLYFFSQNDWKELNIRYVKGGATRLDPRTHQLELGPSGTLTYDRLLLATGASAVPLNVPGANLPGVVKLDHLEDTRQILSLARRNRAAVVTGGGIIAIELVEGLAAQGIQVHYFLRGDRYWSNVLDEAESRIIEQRLNHDGVQIHYHTEIAEILGRGGKVAGVRTKKGESLRCGVVAVGIGVKSRIELAQAAGLKTERGILTDEYLQTSDPDVFSAGDAAQVFDPAIGQSVQRILWWPAREQGRLAGVNMAGRRQAYRNPVTVNITRLTDLTICIIGAVGSGLDEDLVSIARGSSETWRTLPNAIPVGSGSDINHVRLMLGERTLLGALIMGEQKLSLPLEEIIFAQVDITSIRAQLLQPGAPLGHLVMDYWSGIKG